MGRYLSSRDCAAALAFVGRLHAVRHDFPQWLAREIGSLVGADHVTWNDVALTVPWTHVVQWPDLPDLERRTAVFSRHMLEHPNLQHWVRTGDLRPTKLSDHVTPRALHALGLYDELYSEIGYEDQLSIFLRKPGPTGQSLGLARGRRSFTERDRALLDLVRPHIALAHSNLEAYERARRALRDRDAIDAQLGVALMIIDATGRVLHGPPRALAWLAAYFDDRCAGGVAPATLRAWLRSAGGGPSAVLTRRRGGRMLVARRFAARDGATPLVLEERTCFDGAEHLRDTGVTPREIEVLREVERGATNDEIAATLCISPRTVKKHLQHAFAKLGVTHRTAAVARLRQFAPGS